MIALGSVDEAQDVAQEWGRLPAEGASDIFTSPAWCLAGWRAFPDLGVPLLLIAIDSAGVLLGALPLTSGPNGPTWAASPLGDEHDLRVHRGRSERRAVSALLRSVPTLASGGETVLADVRPGGVLAGAARSRRGCPAPILQLEDPDGEFGALACLPGWSRERRRTLRSARRRLEQSRQLSVVRISDPGSLAAALPVFARTRRASWASRGRLAVSSQRMGQRKRGPEPEQRPGAPGFFATTLPGLGILLRQEIEANPDLTAVGDLGNDGRADIVFFRVRRGARPEVTDLRLAEDVFVTLSESGAAAPKRVAESLVTRTGLERSLSVWTRFVRHLSSSMSYRVIARVVDEGRFKRTELRAAVTTAVAAQRPRWRVGDPADLELWVLEYQQARFVAGLRLSDKRMRQHGSGRETERHGALRPVVAAAMMRLAGQAPGRVLDPCCGSGTILAEALSAGWEAVGSDLDSDAVAIARQNVPQAVVDQADVLELPHEDATFDALVSNLPFGRQFPSRIQPAGSCGPWLRWGG